ncbi:MAG TPA: hypothetical protein VF590_12140, partial [Isosphaeraceae bacterium]
MRRLSPVAAVLVTVLWWAACPTPALASRMTATAEAVDGTATFQLVNALGAPTAERALALILPPETIAPPRPSISPLTILPGSSGFDQDNLKVLLLDGVSPRTGEEHDGVALGLVFDNGGFAPGGVLNFQVSLRPGFQGPLTLDLIAPTPQTLAFGEGPPPPGGGGTDGGPVPPPGTQVPEPLSVILWSSLAGLGLFRAHAFRRAQAAQA